MHSYLALNQYLEKSSFRISHEDFMENATRNSIAEILLPKLIYLEIFWWSGQKMTKTWKQIVNFTSHAICSKGVLLFRLCGGHFISSQCGNLRTFLPLKFYVKSKLAVLEIAILTIQKSKNFYFQQISGFEIAKIHQNQDLEVLKLSKLHILRLQSHQNMISRKI